MADRFARSALAVLALAGIASSASTSASARTHHSAATTTHHATKAKKKPVAHAAATPAGVTSVPAGGLKVYCAARKSPLLIRKATQGAGTTVTVVCR